MNARLKTLVEEMSSEDNYKCTVSVTAHSVIQQCFVHT